MFPGKLVFKVKCYYFEITDSDFKEHPASQSFPFVSGVQSFIIAAWLIYMEANVNDM